jgi:hypothetical protein
MFKILINTNFFRISVIIFAFFGYLTCSLHVFPEIDHNSMYGKHQAQENATNCFSHDLSISTQTLKTSDPCCDCTLANAFDGNLNLSTQILTFSLNEKNSLNYKIPLYLKNKILLI